MTVLNDISSIVKSLLAIAVSTSVPVFLMGHSMGGAEVLQVRTFQSITVLRGTRTWVARHVAGEERFFALKKCLTFLILASEK